MFTLIPINTIVITMIDAMIVFTKIMDVVEVLALSNLPMIVLIVPVLVVALILRKKLV